MIDMMNQRRKKKQFISTIKASLGENLPRWYEAKMILVKAETSCQIKDIWRESSKTPKGKRMNPLSPLFFGWKGEAAI